MIYFHPFHPSVHARKYIQRSICKILISFNQKLPCFRIQLCLCYLVQLTSLPCARPFGVCFHLVVLSSSLCISSWAIWLTQWLQFLSHMPVTAKPTALTTSFLNFRHNFDLLMSRLNFDFLLHVFSTSKTELIFHPNMFLSLFPPAPLIILSRQARSLKVII